MAKRCALFDFCRKYPCNIFLDFLLLRNQKETKKRGNDNKKRKIRGKTIQVLSAREFYGAFRSCDNNAERFKARVCRTGGWRLCYRRIRRTYSIMGLRVLPHPPITYYILHSRSSMHMDPHVLRLFGCHGSKEVPARVGIPYDNRHNY